MKNAYFPSAFSTLSIPSLLLLTKTSGLSKREYNVKLQLKIDLAILIMLLIQEFIYL